MTTSIGPGKVFGTEYIGLKLQSDPTPRPSWRTGSVEGGVLDGEFAIDCRERSGDERTLGRESRRAELCRGVVPMVKQVPDLNKQFQPPMHLVTPAEVDHTVTWRGSGTEIVGAIGLVQVVLVAAG